MALRKIVTVGDDVLTKKCREVVKFDKRLSQLIDDMADTLKESGGVGLAAPQVGILRRVVVIDVGEGLIELVNPKIIAYSGNQETLEGCLSLPNQWGITTRPEYVKVKALDRFGKPFETDGHGLLAKAFCHELDHLEGILFTDVAVRMVSSEEMEKQSK